MKSKNAEDINVHKFALGEVIDISMVNSLYDALKLLLNEATQVVIDAKAVKRLDTAAMQLILCWYRETQSKNITVTWKNTNGTFSNAATMLGMSRELALDQ